MKEKDFKPPFWADRFLAWFCSEDLLEEIQGDLHEAYHHRVREIGRAKANRLYIADVFLFFKPYAFEKYSRAKQFLPMFDNYFKVALRNILHQKGFTTINLVGLTFGISAVMLIGLYLKHELTYDRSVPDHGRIHRLMNQYRAQIYTPMFFNDYFQSNQATQLRLLEHLTEYEEVEVACHFVPSQSAIGGGDQFFVETDGKRFIAEDVLYTNTGMQFQEIFPQQFLLGTPESAFSDYNRVVITEKLAVQWFGKSWRQQEIIGTDLTIREEVFELAGVIKNVPDNVHYAFDWIIHQKEIPSWGAYTYLKLMPNASIELLVTRLNAEIDQVYPGYTEDVLSKGVCSVPLTDIHFTPGTLYELKPVANRAYLATFGMVGLIILLIILTNYTNLSLSMYAGRQHELGVRKILGARPQDISFQLLAEAILVALLCFPLCLLILQYALPYFYDLMEMELREHLLYSAWVLLSLLALLVLTGILSGIYPAIVNSNRSIVHLLGQRLGRFKAYRHFNFRNVLLTVQFVMVISLLSITYFIFQQMKLVQTKDLGYQKEGVIYFGIDGPEKYAKLREALMAIPEIESVGANGVPGSEMFNQSTYKMKDTELTLSDGTQEYLDLGSLQTLGIPCDACQQLEAGKTELFVINQTAAEKLAKIKGVAPMDLIGETLVTEPEWENEEFGYGIHQVVDGIIDDFKFFSLKYPNQSLLLNIVAEPTWVNTMMVRAKTDDWAATLRKIESAYAAIEEVRPFDFTFLEDRLNQLYVDERRSSILMGGLSLIAVILALMGLAGIVSYMTYSRQKRD